MRIFLVAYMNSDLLIANEVQPKKTVQQLSLADERLKTEMATIHLPLLTLMVRLTKPPNPLAASIFMIMHNRPAKHSSFMKAITMACSMTSTKRGSWAIAWLG